MASAQKRSWIARSALSTASYQAALTMTHVDARTNRAVGEKGVDGRPSPAMTVGAA